MHSHMCRHCEVDFVCDESLECFHGSIVCSECWWSKEMPLLLFFLGCGTIALIATVILFHFYED
jgi:hypothetical protein